MNQLIITRREALLGASALGTLSMIGCTQAQIAQWVAAEQALAQEFTIVTPQLVALGFNPASQITVGGAQFSLPTLATLAQKLTAAIGAASTVSQGQSTLITIETYINAVVPVIWPVVQPLIVAANPGAGLAIGLMVAAMPAVEGLLNFGVDFGKTFLTAQALQLAALAPSAAPVAGRVGSALAPARLTPDEALALLLARNPVGMLSR